MEVFMQWHDLMKIDEPEEDLALRAEFQNILGMNPVQHSHSDPAPDDIALVKSLYREAMRRRRTAAAVAPMSRRPLFILVAAAIPVIFSVAALGTWGVKQKRRADILAAKTKELETKQNRIDAARERVRSRENQPSSALESELKPIQADAGKNQTPNNNGELIKPEERPRSLSNHSEQYRVNNSR
jgi:hypothetical protein